MTPVLLHVPPCPSREYRVSRRSPTYLRIYTRVCVHVRMSTHVYVSGGGTENVSVLRRLRWLMTRRTRCLQMPFLAVLRGPLISRGRETHHRNGNTDTLESEDLWAGLEPIVVSEVQIGSRSNSVRPEGSCPSTNEKPSTTRFHLLVGPGSPWRGRPADNWSVLQTGTLQWHVRTLSKKSSRPTPLPRPE